jgi:hypothetical protein
MSAIVLILTIVNPNMSEVRTVDGFLTEEACQAAAKQWKDTIVAEGPGYDIRVVVSGVCVSRR